MQNILQKTQTILFYTLILLLPTQLGKHYWPPSANLQGLPIDYLSPTLYLTDLLITTIFLLTITKFLKSKIKILKTLKHLKIEHSLKIENLKLKINLPLLCFLYLLLTITLSGNYANGLYALAKLLEYSFLIWYTATTIKQPKQITTITICFATATIFESIIAISQYFTQSSLNGLFYYLGERAFTSSTPGIANASINGQLLLRPYATFPHPNVLAGYLLIPLTLILSTLTAHLKHIPTKLYLLLALILGTTALLFTFSRTAILAWIIETTILLTFRFYNKPARQKNLLPILLTLTTITILSLTSFRPIITRFLQTNPAEESIIIREQQIQSTIHLIQTHPLFGVGLGNFLPALAYTRQHSPTPYNLPLTTYYQPVHNIILYLTAETGIIGLALTSLLILQLTRQTLQKTTPRKLPLATTIALLSAILFTGMFDHYWLTVQQGQLLLAILLGLTLIT